MKNKKDNGIFLRVTNNEKEIMKILKTKHFINISAFFRESLNTLYDKLEKKDENHV